MQILASSGRFHGIMRHFSQPGFTRLDRAQGGAGMYRIIYREM